MGVIVEKAKEELKLIRGDSIDPDEVQDLIEKQILEVIEIFEKQNHSGNSSAYCIPIINRLLQQEPLLPLTGNDNEWVEFSEGKFQNKRCFYIFKDSENFNGQAYNIE